MATLAIQSNDNEPLIRRTFGAASINVTPAATPTVIWCMSGVAGGVIRVKSLSLYGVATGNGAMYAVLKRLNALPSAGTAVAVTPGSHDSGDASILGGVNPTIQHYTANPSAIAGITVATIHGAAVGFAPGGSLGVANWSMGWLNDKAIALRSATDVLALDLLGGAVPSGGAFTVDVEYTLEVAGNSFDALATA